MIHHQRMNCQCPEEHLRHQFHLVLHQDSTQTHNGVHVIGDVGLNKLVCLAKFHSNGREETNIFAFFECDCTVLGGKQINLHVVHADISVTFGVAQIGDVIHIFIGITIVIHGKIIIGMILIDVFKVSSRHVSIVGPSYRAIGIGLVLVPRVSVSLPAIGKMIIIVTSTPQTSSSPSDSTAIPAQ